MTLRRDFLGFTAGAVVARTILPVAARVAERPPFIPAMSPDHPDAALIAACMAFMKAEAALFAVPDDAPDDAHSEATDRYHDRHKALIDIRATTLAGLKAKTRAVIGGFEMMVAISCGSTVEDSASWHELGAYRVLQDVLLLGAA